MDKEGRLFENRPTEQERLCRFRWDMLKVAVTPVEPAT